MVEALHFCCASHWTFLLLGPENVAHMDVLWSTRYISGRFLFSGKLLKLIAQKLQHGSPEKSAFNRK